MFIELNNHLLSVYFHWVVSIFDIRSVVCQATTVIVNHQSCELVLQIHFQVVLCCTV